MIIIWFLWLFIDYSFLMIIFWFYYIIINHFFECWCPPHKLSNLTKPIFIELDAILDLMKLFSSANLSWKNTAAFKSKVWENAFLLLSKWLKTYLREDSPPSKPSERRTSREKEKELTLRSASSLVKAQSSTSLPKDWSSEKIDLKSFFIKIFLQI